MPKFPQAAHDFYKSNGPSAEHAFFTEGPSLTRSEFAEECDINTLMSKYDAHVIGGPGGLAPQMQFYADFTTMPGSLLEYMDFISMAQEQFMRLPAAVRRTFDNSPHEFVEFASNPDNLEQMRTWGLAAPAKPQEPGGQEEPLPPAPPAPPPVAPK